MGLEAEIDAADERTSEILKATVYGKSASDPLLAPSSNAARAGDDDKSRFSNSGAIDPPFNPETLAWLCEHSSALRQNVDAYCTNIDAFGHHFDPVIDLESAEADSRISQSIQIERVKLRETPGVPREVVMLPLTPTPDEVKERKELMRVMMQAEKARLQFFFDFCSDDMSFVTLRRRLRQDLETTGNAYVEVVRNGAGEITEFVYLPSFTMRLTATDKEPTEADVARKISDIEYETVKKLRHFRRFVQVVDNRRTFFKEFGDARPISKKTGQVQGATGASPAVMSGGSAAQNDVPVMHSQDATKPQPGTWACDDGPATEVLHFKIHSARSAYGVPRWIGTLLAILGTRQAEEVNYNYFDNKSVPPLALIVSGGKISNATIDRIKDHVNNEIKGKGNFHNILVIEGIPAAGGGAIDAASAGKMQIQLQPLTEAQQKDALFLEYDERNADKVGQSFRLPRLLRGDSLDFNRATAESALDFAEKQVFAPERDEFDFIINRKILADLKIKFWRFASNAPTEKDPVALGDLVQKLTLANILTPEEARELASKVFNRDFKKIDEAWVKQPVPLTLAGLSAAAGGLGPLGDTPPATDEEAAKKIGPLVTRTALGYVTTVNEARVASGLGPLMNGEEPDPRGELTINAFVEQERMTKGNLEGGRSLTIDDLQTRAGQLALAQGRGFIAIGDKVPNIDQTVKYLVALRDRLIDAEAVQAAETFYKAKRRELLASNAGIPDEILREFVPAEMLEDGDASAAAE